MPELPEVETIRRELHGVLLRRQIRSAEIRRPKMIRGSAAAFRKHVANTRIVAVARRAKLIIFKLSNHYSFVIHLKMTGQLIYVRRRMVKVGGHPIKDGTVGLPNKYSHVIFSFADGGHLFFNDQRQFGFIQLLAPGKLDLFLANQHYGPEPLTHDFTFDYFKKVLAKKKSPIKQVLMDQTVIAGIGNIYAAEACFYARVRPARQSSSLTPIEAKKLYQGIKVILTRALRQKGASADTYVDAFGDPGHYVPSLFVYGRTGLTCRRCRTKIKNIVLGGRSSAYCPQCQR